MPGVKTYIALDPSRYVQGARQVRAENQSLGAGAASLKQLFSRVFVGLSVGKVVSDLVRVNMEFEDLRANLETVVGAGAGAAFEQIKQFAAATPFQVKNITEAFIQLQAIGVDATSDRMTALGNIAAAFGRDITDIARGVQGAVTGEMEILKSFGIVARVEGEQLAVTFKGVTKKIARDGKAILQLLEDIGNKDFAGAMDRRALTLSGRLSTLKDAYANFLDVVGKTEDLKIAVSWLTKLVNKASEFINSQAGVDLAIADPKSVDNLQTLAKAFIQVQTSLNELGGFLRGGEGINSNTLQRANLMLALDAISERMETLRAEAKKTAPELVPVAGGIAKVNEALQALVVQIEKAEMVPEIMEELGISASNASDIIDVLFDKNNTSTPEEVAKLIERLNAAKGAAIDAGAVIDKLLGFDKRIPLDTVDLSKFDAESARRRAGAIAAGDKVLEQLRQRDALIERIGTREEKEAAIRRRVNELAKQLLLTEAQRARIMAEQLGILIDQSKLIRGLGAAASIIGSLPGSASQLGPFVQSFTDQFARFRRVMVEGGAEAEGYGSRLEAVRSISAQAASTAIGLANALGMLSSRQQELAGALGAAGAIAGGIFGGPVGAEVGAAVGQILGVVIGGMQSVEQTFADGGAVLGRLAAQLHEGTGQLAELTNQAVQSIVDTVNGIVEETGIALQELSPGSQRGTFGFQIRQRGDEIIAVKAWVDGVMREFASIDQAIGFVVTEMIRRADASGADPFVRVALETFAGNTIDGLNRALAEAFERQQLVASVDQLGLGRLQALGRTEDIEDRVRRQAEAWNAQRNALEASLLAVRARILADQAQAESSAAVARVQVESNRSMLEGMLNLSEGMQAAGRSATVAGAIVSGAFDDALAAVDAALAGLDALIGESEIMEAVDRQRREANRGRREAREAARAAAQAELDLLIVRAQGGAAAEELLRRQMEEAALVARLTEALPGLTAAEIELLQARIRSQAATESILAAGSDILDRIESQRIEELFGSVGSGIFDLADAMAEAQQQIFDAVQGGGSPFEAIRRMGELSDAAPDAIRRMLEAALESAASDPEAIAALRRQLSDLLLNLPQELEGQRDLIAAFAAGLGIDLANALSGAIITAQSSIASFGGELASALQRFGGAAAVTEDERARLLEIEFRLIQAQAVVRISQLRQEIAAMQALGALVSSQLDDLGFLETLAGRLAELEPDFGALAREVNGAQNAVRDFGDAAERTGEQLRQAAEAADAGLERLRDELLGGRLSGLSGLEQNQFALDRVRDLITRARGGDVDARRELESEGRNLIELAMQNLDVGGAGSQRQELLAALDDILRHPVPIPDDPVVEAIRQVRQAIDDLSVTQDNRLADLVAAANTIPAGLTSIKDGLKPIADGLGLVPIELQKIPTALDALGDILDNKPGGGGGDLPNFKAATPGYVVDVPAFDQRNQTNFLLAEISGKLDAIEPKGATF